VARRDVARRFSGPEAGRTRWGCAESRPAARRDGPAAFEAREAVLHRLCLARARAARRACAQRRVTGRKPSEARSGRRRLGAAVGAARGRGAPSFRRPPTAAEACPREGSESVRRPGPDGRRRPQTAGCDPPRCNARESVVAVNSGHSLSL
jgi:hypothetical protein